MESSPCTPTPFKSASALQEAKYGPLKLPVSSKLTSSLAVLLLPGLGLTGGLLVQQMVESIKQEPMECAIEQPPLKKIKQEVSTPQKQLRSSSADKGKMSRFFFLFLAAAANVGRQRLFLPLQQLD